MYLGPNFKSHSSHLYHGDALPNVPTNQPCDDVDHLSSLTLRALSYKMDMLRSLLFPIDLPHFSLSLPECQQKHTIKPGFLNSHMLSILASFKFGEEKKRGQ